MLAISPTLPLLWLCVSLLIVMWLSYLLWEESNFLPYWSLARMHDMHWSIEFELILWIPHLSRSTKSSILIFCQLSCFSYWPWGTGIPIHRPAFCLLSWIRRHRAATWCRAIAHQHSTFKMNSTYNFLLKPTWDIGIIYYYSSTD